MTEPPDSNGDQLIGQAAFLLQRRGHVHAAALMLDVQALDTEQDTYTEDWVREIVKLYVEPYLIPRFTPERKAEILDALNTIVDSPHGRMDAVVMREVLPEVGTDWRQRLSEDLTAQEPTNQGLSPPARPPVPHLSGPPAGWPSMGSPAARARSTASTWLSSRSGPPGPRTCWA